jgi:hypothetical protein
VTNSPSTRRSAMPTEVSEVWRRLRPLEYGNSVGLRVRRDMPSNTPILANVSEILFGTFGQVKCIIWLFGIRAVRLLTTQCSRQYYRKRLRTECWFDRTLCYLGYPTLKSRVQTRDSGLGTRNSESVLRFTMLATAKCSATAGVHIEHKNTAISSRDNIVVRHAWKQRH